MTERQNKTRGLGDLLGPDAMKQGPEQKYTCEQHGAYRGKPFTLTGQTWIPPACPSCEEEIKQQHADEAEREREEAASRMITVSGIPQRFRKATLETYHAETAGQQRAKAIIQRYLERFDERRKAGGCLMLIGRTGTGKTHLACSMVSELLLKGYSALYTDTMGLMQRIKETYNHRSDETEEQAIARFVRPDLLVIDEIGVQYGTDTERAILHHILDRRYLAVRPTVVVGNVDLEGLKAYLGERAVSRLHEAAGLAVAFDWEDHRMRRKS